MKCSGSFSLFLVFSFNVLSGQLFVPPGVSPNQGGEKPLTSPADSTVSDSPDPTQSTTTPSPPLVIDIEVEETSLNSTTPVATQATTASDTTTATQPLKIEIDMEELAGNSTDFPTQAGVATEPVWHAYLIKITSGTGMADAGAETTSPPLLTEPTQPATVEDELIIVEPPEPTEETKTTMTTTTTAPQLVTEELTLATEPPAKETRPKSIATEMVEVLETTPQPVLGQQFVLNKRERGEPTEAKDASAPKKKKQPDAKETKSEGEANTPKPKAPARKQRPSAPMKKQKSRAPEIVNSTNISGLLPSVVEVSSDKNESERNHIYLVITEIEPNATAPQKESELPVAVQIIGTRTKDAETDAEDTVISINGSNINVEEITDKEAISEPKLKEMYFNQLVDHFSFANHQKIYRQRYLITDQFWGKSVGPIFLYTGNEDDIWDFANSSKFVFELASEKQALVIFAEHRYYGKSLPFGKKSYDKSNIGYLTVEQAVADYVVLVTRLKTELQAENCPVVAFGGSYGGMLSAYMRIKYPNVVAGALASSAPVVSTANIGDGRQFFHDVTKDFERNSPHCVSKIQDAFQELESLAQQQAWSKISNKLSLCKSVKSRKEVDHLYGWARNAFTYLAMFNYPYKAEAALNFPANPVDVACGYILKNSDHIDGLLDILGIFYNSTGTKKCFDIFTEYVHCADPTGCGMGSASQAWDFQACTEINLLYESTNDTDMFPALHFTGAMRRNYCHSKWGVYPNPEWLKIQYWGADFKAASNIIFSNGDLDPWANGGILKNVNPLVVAFVIEGGAHHLDLRAPNPADPPSVTAIRKKESNIISEWVKKHQLHNV